MEFWFIIIDLFILLLVAYSFLKLRSKILSRRKICNIDRVKYNKEVFRNPLLSKENKYSEPIRPIECDETMLMHIKTDAENYQMIKEKLQEVTTNSQPEGIENEV